MLVRYMSTTQGKKAAQTIAEQWKNNPAEDKAILFSPKTWMKYWELTPVVFSIVFAGSICGGYILYAFNKEDVRLNPRQRNAPYEDYLLKEPRTHFMEPQGRRRIKDMPEEVREMKKQLGPYKAY